MRYVLHFNPEGTSLLGKQGKIEFVKLPKALKNGAVTKVRVSGTGDVPFTARDKHDTRYGCAISEGRAKDAGFRNRKLKRFKLQQSGSSGWFNLVPDSSKTARIDGPGVSVSVIEG